MPDILVMVSIYMIQYYFRQRKWYMIGLDVLWQYGTSFLWRWQLFLKDESIWACAHSLWILIRICSKFKHWIKMVPTKKLIANISISLSVQPRILPQSLMSGCFFIPEVRKTNTLWAHSVQAQTSRKTRRLSKCQTMNPRIFLCTSL